MCSLGFDATYRRQAESVIDVKKVVEEHVPAWDGMDATLPGDKSNDSIPKGNNYE